MRYMELDQYEFEPSGSEQCILFAQSHVRQHDDIYDFFGKTRELYGFSDVAADGISAPTYLSKTSGKSCLHAFLTTETDLILREDTQVFVRFDDWNLFDLTFQIDHHFIRFQWSTTA